MAAMERLLPPTAHTLAAKIQDDVREWNKRDPARPRFETRRANERAARAASPGGWTYGDVDSVAGGSLYDETRMIGSLHYEQPSDHDGSIVRHLLSHEADANGQHIARHDPARVLAEVARDRAILDACEETLAREDSWVARFVIRQLAQPFAGRPGWREEWAT